MLFLIDTCLTVLTKELLAEKLGCKATVRLVFVGQPDAPKLWGLLNRVDPASDAARCRAHADKVVNKLEVLDAHPDAQHLELQSEARQ